MARPLRIEYAGAIYHVMCRGNDRRDIFLNDSDRYRFLLQLKESACNYKVEVMSYVLMNNHYHLLLKTHEANLSKFMQWLNVAYTMYFNKRHNRVGHLFQGRFKSILVGSEEYLLSLSRYIHMNPLRTSAYKGRSISDRQKLLKDYLWSSYQGMIEPNRRQEYLSVKGVLDQLGGDTPKGRNSYMRYIQDAICQGSKNPLEEVKYQLVLGSESFIEWLKEKFLKKKDLREYSQKRVIQEQPKSISKIAEYLGREYNTNSEELLSKRGRNREAREMLLIMGYQSNIGKQTATHIAGKLGLTVSALKKAYDRGQAKMSKDEGFKKRAESFFKAISTF